MRYSVNVKTAPAAEPISLTEAKLHLRVDDDDQDALISGLIAAAREWAENYTRRSFVQRTLELRLDCFVSPIKLPSGPVISVTSVQYMDQAGVLQTLAADRYQVDLYGTPPCIVPVFGVVWPVTKYGTLNSVVVEYEAGYADSNVSPPDLADNVPSAVKAALKLIVGHLYENREAVVLANVQAIQLPMAVKSLLAPYEIRDFSLGG